MARKITSSTGTQEELDRAVLRTDLGSKVDRKNEGIQAQAQQANTSLDTAQKEKPSQAQSASTATPAQSQPKSPDPNAQSTDEGGDPDPKPSQGLEQKAGAGAGDGAGSDADDGDGDGNTPSDTDADELSLAEEERDRRKRLRANMQKDFADTLKKRDREFASREAEHLRRMEAMEAELRNLRSQSQSRAQNQDAPKPPEFQHPDISKARTQEDVRKAYEEARKQHNQALEQFHKQNPPVQPRNPNQPSGPAQLPPEVLSAREQTLTRHPDFKEVVTNNRDLVPSPIQRLVAERHPMGFEYAYWMGQNPLEANRMGQLPPDTQLMEIGAKIKQLEAELQATQGSTLTNTNSNANQNPGGGNGQPPSSSAKPKSRPNGRSTAELVPPGAGSGGGLSDKAPENYGDYVKWRREQLRQKQAV